MVAGPGSFGCLLFSSPRFLRSCGGSPPNKRDDPFSYVWSRKAQSVDKEASMSELDPSPIMQVGMGFFASKTLLSAVELGLFTELAKRPMTGAEIVRTLGLSHRAVPDFPDALVALKFLERTGDGANARYSNTPESAIFLDRQSAGYIGGILEMASARLYRFWGAL